MERKSSPLKSFLFTIFIIFILFLSLEGLARAYSCIRNKSTKNILDTLPMAISNENRIFGLKSNYYQKYISLEFQMDIIINNGSLRDIYHSISKPKGVYKILALGGSMTFG